MASRFLIYGRSTCSFCTRSVKLLEELEQENIFFDFTEDPEAIEDAKRFYDWPTVPIILENDKETGKTSFIGGFADLDSRFPEDI